MKVIAHIHTDFGSKFGVPRQSGVVDSLESRIVFEPEYRVADALRGLEGFSHLWLIWEFSEVTKARASKAEGGELQSSVPEWSPTVRPPRLGGNKRMGVFATRSPFRPNPIGLSSVRISRIDLSTSEGPVIYVSGADLMDGTPIFDIKPYLAFTDSHPDALGGFTQQTLAQESLEVSIPESVAARFTEAKLVALREVLAQDPRPHYQSEPDRVYGLEFAGVNVRFRVSGTCVEVLEV